MPARLSLPAACQRSHRADEEECQAKNRQDQ
jgi:hypothetical protein